MKLGPTEGCVARGACSVRNADHTRTTDYAPRTTPVTHHAFTLLEVIIACSIFFIFAFAILNLVITGIAQAKALRHREPDAGMLAAVLSLTNKLEEGVQSGDFEDLAGGLYRDY